MCPSHLRSHPLGCIGLRVTGIPRPDANASYALAVRQAGTLLTASFRSRIAPGTLAVRLAVPTPRARRGLPPPGHRPATTPAKRCLSAPHAMPGTPCLAGRRAAAPVRCACEEGLRQLVCRSRLAQAGGVERGCGLREYAGPGRALAPRRRGQESGRRTGSPGGSKDAARLRSWPGFPPPRRTTKWHGRVVRTELAPVPREIDWQNAFASRRSGRRG